MTTPAAHRKLTTAGKADPRRLFIRGCRRSVPETTFKDVLSLIDAAKRRAYQAVNTELVTLYWQVGSTSAKKLASAEWGDGVVVELARAIARRYPGVAKGFTRSNLFHMCQFFEAYCHHAKSAPLVRQLSWSHHSSAWSVSSTRNACSTCAARSPSGGANFTRQCRARVSACGRRRPRDRRRYRRNIRGGGTVLDVYSLEFLEPPDEHTEAGSASRAAAQPGRFITELGRDFCFVGSEYPVQVGKQGLRHRPRVFHRGLCCLVAVELKVRVPSRGSRQAQLLPSARPRRRAPIAPRSAFCSAPPRTQRSSSSRSAARYLRRWWLSTRRCCHPGGATGQTARVVRTTRAPRGKTQRRSGMALLRCQRRDQRRELLAGSAHNRDADPGGSTSLPVATVQRDQAVQNFARQTPKELFRQSALFRCGPFTAQTQHLNHARRLRTTTASGCA